MFPAVMAMDSRESKMQGLRQARFDADSKLIRVDNCASYSITHDLSDIVGPMEPLQRPIKGLGGPIDGAQKGTIRWVIEDDDGRPQEVLLPGGIYLPNSPSRLLSPQHWAQVTAGNVQCTTYKDRVVLNWCHGTRQRTIPINEEGGNVAAFYTAPSYSQYVTFMSDSAWNDDEEEIIIGVSTHIISDDEEPQEEESLHEDWNTQPDLETYEEPPNGEGEPTRSTPITFDLDQVGTPAPITIEPETEQEPADSLTAQYLQWHHRLNHLPPTKMCRMAKLGMIPRRLAKAQVPACSACVYRKATRRPWRTKPTKGQQGGKLRTAATPGECVSVDQLESSTPGLIGQIKGWITTQRYRVATVFVDNYSGLSYVHLQKSTNADDTIEAKKAFESYAHKSGVIVKHYHADNGRFCERAFKEETARLGQTMTYCGVNAHFQNSVAERRIRTLQDQARTMIIHAQHRWPTAIDAHLWPYALRMANDIHNATPATDDKEGLTPYEKFHRTKVRANYTHMYPFGCPGFVLNDRMQAGGKIPKWEWRARVGVYLGSSPSHARTVALILNLQTGYVSPQFHVKMDPKFETVRKAFGNVVPPSMWQEACRFREPRRG